MKETYIEKKERIEKNIKKIIDKIFDLPMVDKYADEYQEIKIWACVEPYEIVIALCNARKNWFNKTIEQIKQIAGVQDAYYQKAQDETVSDRLIITLIKGIEDEKQGR